MDNRIDPDDTEIQFIKEVNEQKAVMSNSGGVVHMLKHSGSGVFFGTNTSSQKSLKFDELEL